MSDLPPITRAGENAIAVVTELAEKMKADGFGPHDIWQALMFVAHLEASQLHFGATCLHLHADMAVEAGDVFECVVCNRFCHPDMGAADDQPDTCDECFDAKCEDVAREAQERPRP